MSSPRRTLLIDSSGVLHRCFHGYQKAARRGTIGDREIDVSGLYGYLEYTCRLMGEFECERIIHVLDPHEGSKYRYDLYPEYKAGRSPTPPELTEQKHILPHLIEAIGHAYIQVPGVESDDILATLAFKARAEGDLVLIISQDKDLLQLVDEEGINVARYVHTSDKSGKIHEFFENDQDVVRCLGVHANQVADYLAIVGDKVDNIPGVKNAGDKTAAQWLSKYGNLATLITNAGEVTGRGANDLRATLDKLPLYQKLTTVLTELDVDFPSPPARDAELCQNALNILNAPSYWMERFGFVNESGYTARSPRM